MKKIYIAFNLLLYFWFTLDMTGASVSGKVIVESAFLSEDGIFWLLYTFLMFNFIKKKEKSTLHLMLLYCFWAILQSIMTIRFILFPDLAKIEGYNEHFINTYHIIAPRTDMLIPDFYHIVLFTLIFINLGIAIYFNKKENIAK